MYKVLKHIYGKSNCVNMHKALRLCDKKQPLVAVNDLVGKCISKTEVNKSAELAKIEAEVKQYID